MRAFPMAKLAGLILAGAAAAAPAPAQSPCPGIHVKILDIRNSTGSVACALFVQSTRRAEGAPEGALAREPEAALAT